MGRFATHNLLEEAVLRRNASCSLNAPEKAQFRSLLLWLRLWV